MKRSLELWLVVLTGVSLTACADELSTSEAVVGSLEKSDWRTPLAENRLYMQLPRGEIVIELAPSFAPRNVENIRTLVRERYYDGLAIIRSQDNYVVQWGDPADGLEHAKPIGSATPTVVAEFFRSASNLDLIPIDSRDAYADEVGFADGFPVGSDGKRAWLTHCYGMVGVARGQVPNSGNGTSLYVVTGHAPRHLDRNIALVGRVLTGMEHLSTLPRGSGALGFYESEAEQVPIISVRTGEELADHSTIEVMRTDSESFRAYVNARTHRNEEWFVDPGGRIELCNIYPPIRQID